MALLIRPFRFSGRALFVLSLPFFLMLFVFQLIFPLSMILSPEGKQSCETCPIQSGEPGAEASQGNSTDPGPIVIGLVTCANPNKKSNPSVLEALTLIKSVLISVKVFQVGRPIEFYVFANSETIFVIRRKVSKYAEALGNEINFRVNFYHVDKTIIQDLRQTFMFHLGIRKCAYMRLFFPDLLPNLDKILYLDTDTIVTGNIEFIWESILAGMRKHPESVAAMAPNTMKGDRFGHTFLSIFRGLPHVPPRGVNSGVIFMNLEKMRHFNWTERVVQVFHKGFRGYYKEPSTIRMRYETRGHWKKKSTGIRRNPKHSRIRILDPAAPYLRDQQLINIIFSDHIAKLFILPCHFNFMHIYCDRGWTCRDALLDSYGIHIVHGAGGNFDKKDGSSLYSLYKAYQQFDLLQFPNQIAEMLLKPVKANYSDSKNLLRNNCRSGVGPQLFRTLQLNPGIGD